VTLVRLPFASEGRAGGVQGGAAGNVCRRGLRGKMDSTKNAMRKMSGSGAQDWIVATIHRHLKG